MKKLVFGLMISLLSVQAFSQTAELDKFQLGAREAFAKALKPKKFSFLNKKFQCWTMTLLSPHFPGANIQVVEEEGDLRMISDEKVIMNGFRFIKHNDGSTLAIANDSYSPANYVYELREEAGTGFPIIEVSSSLKMNKDYNSGLKPIGSSTQEDAKIYYQCNKEKN